MLICKIKKNVKLKEYNIQKKQIKKKRKKKVIKNFLHPNLWHIK